MGLGKGVHDGVVEAVLQQQHVTIHLQKKHTCEACGESFYLHEDLVKHNVQVHSATLGEQLRQSEGLRKQREHG